MQLTQINYKKNIQGFVIIQTVYAFIMALGLREIFLAVPEFWEGAALQETGIWSPDFLLISLCLISIVLVGIRFFWVPRNLREIVTVYAKTHIASASVKDKISPEDSIRGIVFPVHIVSILIHAALFYHICSEFGRIIYIYSAKDFIKFSDFNTIFFGMIFLLILNGMWLNFIQSQINRRYLETQVAVPSGLKAMSLWWKNNLIGAIAALSFFAMYSSCGGASLTCLASNPQFDSFYWGVVPGAPESWAAPLQAMNRLFSSSATDWIATLIIVSIFILNSVFDLTKTGAAYMIFEDVEWTQPQRPEEDAQAASAPSDEAPTLGDEGRP